MLNKIKTFFNDTMKFYAKYFRFNRYIFRY